MHTSIRSTHDTFPRRERAAKTCMDASETMISYGVLSAFYSQAHKVGVDYHEILRGSGIPTIGRSGPGSLIPARLVGQFVGRLQIAMDDEAMGLLQRPIPVGTFLMLCRSVVHCRTLEEALERFMHSYNLLRYGLTHRLEKRDGTAMYRVDTGQPGSIKDPIITDLLLLVVHKLFSWLVFQEIVVDTLYVGRSEPRYNGEYQKRFLCPSVVFGRSIVGFRFNQKYLCLPVVRSETDLEKFSQKMVADVFTQPRNAGELSFKIRSFLVEELEAHGGMPELFEAADYFGLHPQTLRRYLLQEGTSFQEVKTRVRLDVANHYLSKSKISVEEVAELAGFSESSAFIRAYKGWTNLTPSAYRKSCGGIQRATTGD